MVVGTLVGASLGARDGENVGDMVGVAVDGANVGNLVGDCVVIGSRHVYMDVFATKVPLVQLHDIPTHTSVLPVMLTVTLLMRSALV